MDARQADRLRMNRQPNQITKYGKPGGSEGRGLLAPVKADELPLESLSEFSDAPFAFEEAALLVREDLMLLYYHSCTANRFSEDYLKYSVQLENFIKQTGRYCLTKAALEQKGFSFPNLEEMDIMELIQMVSFHIRKCHAAINGLYRDNDRLGMVYLHMEMRWISLCERLKATSVKIRKIQEGRLNADDLFIREETVREKTGGSVGKPAGSLKGFCFNHNALPLDRSMAAEMIREEKKKEREREKRRREYERLERQTAGIIPDGIIYRPHKIPKRSEPESKSKEVPEGMITEAEARKILIENAIRAGDQKSVTAIPMEDTDTFRARWEKYLSRKTSPPGPLNPGMSENTRKKLREKRKKRK